MNLNFGVTCKLKENIEDWWKVIAPKMKKSYFFEKCMEDGLNAMIHNFIKDLEKNLPGMIAKEIMENVDIADTHQNFDLSIDTDSLSIEAVGSVYVEWDTIQATHEQPEEKEPKEVVVMLAVKVYAESFEIPVDVKDEDVSDALFNILC